MHDNINQVLITSRLYIEHALHNKEKQEEVLKKNYEHLSAVIRDIRRLSRTLMPPALADASLSFSLKEMLSEMSKLSNFDTTFIFEGEDESKLPEPLKLAVFRIVQEQLNNIIRHARASKISLHVQIAVKTLLVEIEDDGIGFEPGSTSKGLGFKNMISRASLFDGRVDLFSEPGMGTKLQLSFPLHHSAGGLSKRHPYSPR